MKKQNHCIAVLTTAAALLAMPLSVSAEFSYEEYFAPVLNYMNCMDTTVSDGEVLYLKQWDEVPFAGLVAVTDGTELTTETAGLSGCTEVIPWDELTADWRALDGFSEESLLLPEGCTAYFLRMPSSVAYELCSAARAYALSEQSITGLYTLMMEEYDGFSWQGRYTIYTSSDVETLDPADFPELAELNGTFRLSETDTENGIHYWDFRSDSSAVNAIYARYPENTMQQVHAYAKQIEAELNENHQDTVLLANANFGFTLESNPDNPTLYTLNDVWENSGDLDGNGKADAADAAGILEYSASNGVRSLAMSAAQAANCDVDCTGVVDAKDAAAVLRFAASNGAGSSSAWTDVLEKTDIT